MQLQMIILVLSPLWPSIFTGTRLISGNCKVHFVSHPYVPEFDDRVGEYFHERDDYGRVLKCLTHSFRDGNIPGIDLRRYIDALKDLSTGLTKQALTGERKQNIPDCERVWTISVPQFFKKKGYMAEK